MTYQRKATYIISVVKFSDEGNDTRSNETEVWDDGEPSDNAETLEARAAELIHDLLYKK